METLITIAIIAAAGLWMVRWLRGTARGDRGCGCGCGDNCPSKKAAGSLCGCQDKNG